MPVDPHIAGLLEMLAGAGAPPMHEGTAAEARASFQLLTVGTRETVIEVGSVQDTTVSGAEGDLRARVYRPEADGPAPTIVLFHGGGWVIGDIETHDAMARTLCRDCEAVVVSVDYRLAPEAAFPAAVDDALAATRWAVEHRADLGGDERVAVAGDSAGGNLAAVVTQLLRDAGDPPLAGQLLVYPATDAAGEYVSRTENAHGYFLEQETMEWFIGQYAPDTATHSDPRISPLLTEDLAGLPPAVVVTAEFDPLRDEGEAYAAALSKAGLDVEVRRFPGMIHGFFDMAALSPGAQAAVEETCRLFGEVLRG